jgi:hypothetical protein
VSSPFVTAGKTGTLSLIGLVTTEKVAIQVPRVQSPDADEDSHWTPLVQDGLPITLDAANNVILVPANLLVRLVKDAGVAGNAYGVQWS